MIFFVLWFIIFFRIQCGIEDLFFVWDWKICGMGLVVGIYGLCEVGFGWGDLCGLVSESLSFIYRW